MVETPTPKVRGGRRVRSRGGQSPRGSLRTSLLRHILFICPPGKQNFPEHQLVHYRTVILFSKSPYPSVQKWVPTSQPRLVGGLKQGSLTPSGPPSNLLPHVEGALSSNECILLFSLPFDKWKRWVNFSFISCVSISQCESWKVKVCACGVSILEFIFN